MRTTLLVAVLVIAGCSRNDAPPPSPTASAPPAAPPDAPPAAPPDDAPAAPAPDAAAAVLLPGVSAAPAIRATVGPEKPSFGCIGWSEQTRQVACITGIELYDAGMEVDVKLSFLGDKAGPHLALHRRSDSSSFVWGVGKKVADRASERLAQDGFVRFTESATPLIPAKATEVAGLSVMWTKKDNGEGGPIHDHEPGEHVGGAGAAKFDQRLSITCGGTKRTLSGDEHYTGDATFRAVADLVVLELAINLGDEGAYGERRQVWVVNPATCKVSASS